MGTNSAPEIANLTCYVDERDFIDGLITSGQTDEAKEHAVNFRFIDDVLGWGIEPPSPLHYGLEWKETTLADGSVVYLGAHIKKIDGRIDISVFDKAAEWPFLVLRYPHSQSNVPYQPSGVFQGQLVRYRIICNTIKNFKHATTQMAIRMLQRDHKPVSLIKGWNAHLAKFNNDRITNYTSLRQWFRRMIKWASYFVKSDRDKSHLNEKSFKQKWKNKQCITQNETKQWVKKHEHSKTTQCTAISDPVPMHKEVPLQKSAKAELHLDEFILAKMEESKTTSQTTSFDQLVTTFSHHNQLPKVLQPHLNRLLLLSNKRKTEAKNRNFTLEATCDQCLQKYKDLMSLKKHHKQKDCNMGKFLVQWMSSKQNLSTLQLDTVIHSNSTVTFPNQKKESAIEKFCATPLSSLSCFHNAKGISGSLVYALGGIISDINCKLPNGSENYLPNPAGRIYYGFIKILLQGVKFDHHHPSTVNFRNISYSTGIDSWFYGSHIDRIGNILTRKTKSSFRYNSSLPIIITEAYFPKLLENPQEANDWVRQTLMELECLDDEGILAERLLFPVNVNSNHWILIELNIKDQTYWPYDPFSPAHPSSSDIVAAELIANAFGEEFGFHFNLQFCDYDFPVQKDGFNCGLFVCLYIISLVLDPSLKPKRFGKSPMEYRILLLAWIIRNDIPTGGI